MKRLMISVPEIHCDHCKMSLEGAVREVPGVSAVEVTIDSRTVDVTFDNHVTSIADITDAIEGQGYEVPDLPR